MRCCQLAYIYGDEFYVSFPFNNEFKQTMSKQDVINIPNSIEGIRISSEKPHINNARLDVGFVLSGGPEPV
jgi:hypothetical protein